MGEPCPVAPLGYPRWGFQRENVSAYRENVQPSVTPQPAGPCRARASFLGAALGVFASHPCPWCPEEGRGAVPQLCPTHGISSSRDAPSAARLPSPGCAPQAGDLLLTHPAVLLLLGFQHPPGPPGSVTQLQAPTRTPRAGAGCSQGICVGKKGRWAGENPRPPLTLLARAMGTLLG